MTTIDGSTAPGFEAVREAFQANFDDGSEVGAAFAAYHRGKKVVDLWGGVADTRAGRPWTEDTLVLVYSTTKGVTAMCANKLAQEGLLDVEAPVATYWPEFAQAGKEDVTVADLLSHRAGLAWIDGTLRSSARRPRGRRAPPTATTPPPTVGWSARSYAGSAVAASGPTFARRSPVPSEPSSTWACPPPKSTASPA
jgi:CubicO group peptidase (beta-lactamase class C family)